MKIRKLVETDRKAIKEVYLRAFGQEKGPEIAELADDLFDDKTAMPLLSLIAEENNQIVGHILFTKVTVLGAPDNFSAQILAPLAVDPDKQGQGVGAKLMKEGLKRLADNGVDLVFVLGHPTYYPRAGFINDALSLGYEAPYPIPQEHADAWMVQELSCDIIGKVKGKIKCADILSQPQHWRE